MWGVIIVDMERVYCFCKEGRGIGNDRYAVLRAR